MPTLRQEGDRLLVFGPQALSANGDDFLALQATVKQQQWIVDSIKDLPKYWKQFVEAFPKYNVIPAEKLLQNLLRWAQTGKLETSHLPNIILSPLVIITHITEYIKYLDIAAPKPESQSSTETLGFCMGFLSALAVSVSKDRQDIEKYGSTAIRLAMIIGGIVDVQDVLDTQGQSKSLATAWNTPKTGNELNRIVSLFPEAYVSVSYDEQRATVTTASKTAAALQQQLRGAGIIANEIGLFGRFHYSWYAEDIQDFIEYFSSQLGLVLPDASQLIYRTRSNSDSGLITDGQLHAHALRTILVQHSNWYQTFKTIHESKLKLQQTKVVSFGPEPCVPPSILREIKSNVVHISEVESVSAAPPRIPLPQESKDDDIAVVGMSIKVAGADDTDEFWDLLCAGQSQHREVPRNRVKFDNEWREVDPKRKYYGNFLNDHDVFDQKFFKKSAREAASTDPQQRILLHVAYQALEQAGYFNSPEQDSKIGCFIGECAADYADNVACHQPNAFTATGNLKSFIAGKVSHYFGWTGTGLTIDTACSSSLVAVHLACKAILSGECNAALAGGVNMMNSALWFQNLAAASFLSPTGQCKPFDAKADGYCRGEAVAVVFLKKMSAAIANGDQILGTISSTGVSQNQNCTPIFVPNAPSLSSLFQNVIEDAKVDPKQITVVEAHGTGTQVGDPAEYDSIRRVLGGPKLRSQPLAFGSVKGLVGHTEASSGVVSLIKTLLMIQKKTIPPQASFESQNPHLNATAEDNMEIKTKLTDWTEEYRAALINNYGASGSNASAVITEAPHLVKSAGSEVATPAVDYPFHIFGKDDRAIRDYCAKLAKSLESKGLDNISVADLSFNVNRQSNPTLDRALVFTSRSAKQLAEKLNAFHTGDTEVAATIVQPSSRPVVLCFGGQISTYVGLSREVYDSVKLLANYLNQCDYVCRSLGCESIFPGIFQRSPIGDTVKLQTMLFSIQYACAKSWIDSGVQPVAVVGHSFGELTSLCISGVLSLEDAIKMIVGRATIIQQSWGSEKGAMMAIEGDLSEVEKLLGETVSPCQEAGERAPTIACLNGPRSFTIAGSSRSIDIASDTISKNPAYSRFRFKKLNVTNAFHSTLVEPLMSDLEKVGQTLEFKEPSIHLERATEFYSSERLSPRYVADHMRNPVFFNHAVQRISKKYPNAIFVEAGSNSTITNMASRALGSPAASHFQPINITTDNGFQLLVDSTVSLWKEGLMVPFWAHSRLQTYDYAPMLLPAYQFEKLRHWMEPVPPPTSARQVAGGQQGDEPKGLWSFVDYKDATKRAARFRINTESDKYKEYVSGHIIAQTAPICPATVEVDIAVEALISLYPEFASSDLEPRICNVDNQSPICIDSSRTVWLDVESQEASPDNWSWNIISEGDSSKNTTLHVTGQIIFVSVNNSEWQLEFSRYERLIGHQRCASLLNSNDADDIIQGRNIYRSFGEVVDYSAPYRGLQKLVGKGNESAGRVVKKYLGETWLDALLSDAFSQVGGIWVNCMTEKDPGDMFIATGFEKWMRSPDVRSDYKRPEAWDVFAYHQELPAEHSYLTDIFIFDSTNGKLVEVILGVNYHKVAKATMSKILARLSGLSIATTSTAARQSSRASDEDTGSSQEAGSSGTESKPKKNKSGGGQDIVIKTKGLLAEISGMGVEEISNDAQLADIGIDSLMGMELARELEGMFKCTLPSDELMNVTDFAGLVQIIKSTLGVGGDDEGSDQEGSDSSPSESSTTFTPSGTSSSSVSDVEDNRPPTKSSGQASYNGDLELPSSTIIEAFEESRKLTDEFITNYRCAGYMETVLPRQTQLCVALTVEAFEELGCPIRSAKAGDILTRIPHDRQHTRLTNYLYKMLEHEARLIDTDGTKITRTAIAPPSKTSDAILEQLLRDFPDHEWANKLTHFAGGRLADVLKGECDGIKLIFGSDEGRRLVTGLYGDSLLNKLANVQMQDVVSRVASKIPRDQGPLKILELGAGTGGTTKGMAALLAKLGVPVEYTFTDLSGSFVAQARKTFKEYPFMKYRVHDIEKPPANDLLGTQHIIIASNAMHATHNLEESTKNVRKALRPDGFLMMLEMTSPVFWVDLIFGLFEGWWLFDDGREHAIGHQTLWERIMRSVGYGHIDWTDGNSPELEIQRVIIALASGPQYSRQPVPPPPQPEIQLQPAAGRKAAVDEYVRKYTEGFALAGPVQASVSSSQYEQCVLITGATGSLGSHLVAHVAALPNVKTVVCLNRRSGSDADARQQKALEERGILLDAASQSKLQVFQATTSKTLLGLEKADYEELLGKVTHIVHNAWPMTGKRPLSGLESQFQVMRNLIDFARDISARRPKGFKVSLQLISSIAVVGHYPLWSGNVVVPEERMTLESVLPNGYGDAKFVCERMLDETLHKYPDQFRVMSVRPGQIAGSKVTGYWNAMEHLSFLIKSSQTLKALPQFEGDLCWTPVDDVAGTCSDLLISDRTPYPVYHIDNPVRQTWTEMIPLLADSLDIPRENIVPFKEWVRRVRAFPGAVEWDNPAALLIDFLDDNFLRMSCGGLLLGTAKSCEHSKTLAAVGPVSADVAKKYIQSWKDSGFLHK